MFKLCIIFVILFPLLHCMMQELTIYPDCGNNPGTSRTLKLTVNSKRNQTGEWVNTFTARTESSNSSENMNLDVTHRVTECDGKRVIYIQGVSTGFLVDDQVERLVFHPRCGKNIAIINKGRTVQKLDPEDRHNSVVFTNRPLKDNEIFEVRLEKKNAKFGHALGIGVMSSTPTQVEILPQMWKSSFAWMYHHSHIYSNNLEFLKNYGKNLDELKVGDRLGVMRNEFGTLHFFINGADQGPAASNIPSHVYGVFELWHDAAKATIVDASSPISS